jgi:hypothetical protein
MLYKDAEGGSDEEKAAWVLQEALRLQSREGIAVELQSLLNRWPDTEGAKRARRWLVEDAVVAGQWERAAALAMDPLAPTDSTSRAAFLSALIQNYTKQSIADSSSEFTLRDSLGSDRTQPYSDLRDWVEARRALAAQSEGDPLRHYLALEGRAREGGWLGLWLAGFLEAPDDGPAWDVFLESWERQRSVIRGSPEGNWIERVLEQRTQER